MAKPYSPSAPGAGNALPNSVISQMISNDDYFDTMINSQIQIMGASLYPTATSGAAFGTLETTTNKNNLRTINFSNSGGKLYAQFAHEMPADYAGGTVTAHFVWYCKNVSTNSVVWGMQGICYADNDALDAAFGTAQEVTDANNANTDLNKSAETSAITIAGTPAAGETVLWQVYRDSGNGSDNLAATAELLAVVITYTRL